MVKKLELIKKDENKKNYTNFQIINFFENNI